MKPSEETCHACGHVVAIVHSRANPEQRWARHTVTGSLTSGDAPECENSGKTWLVGHAVAEAIFDANPYQTWRWDELPRNAVAAYHEMATAAISAYRQLTYLEEGYRRLAAQQDTDEERALSAARRARRDRERAP